MITLNTLIAMINSVSHPEEHKMLRDTAMELLRKGWNIIDVYNYLYCTCYISPNMNEDLACQRMAEISAKYRQ